jgi:hypothetical protein
LLALLIGLARMLPAGQAAMQLGIFDPIAALQLGIGPVGCRLTLCRARIATPSRSRRPTD